MSELTSIVLPENLQTILNQKRILVKEIKELDKHLQQETQSFFKIEAQKILNQASWVRYFGWRQFTTENHDEGDFQTGIGRLEINGNAYYEGYFGKLDSHTSQFIEIAHAIKVMRDQFNDSDLKAIFGEECFVRFNRRGIETISWCGDGFEELIDDLDLEDLEIDRE